MHSHFLLLALFAFFVSFVFALIARDEAAEQLRNAAEIIMQNPAGLELRRMQMRTEVGAEQNTMTIVMMPSEFVSLARSLGDLASRVAAKT